MRALTAHLCWPCARHTSTAVRLALRGGRCRPNEVAGPLALVERASRELAKYGEDESVGFAALAARLDTTPGTLRRAFVQVTGLRPLDLAAALRLARFKKMLREGKGIAEALYETGYGSTSRVY